MKKVLSLILALAMILALTACGSKTDAPSGNGDTQTDPSAEKIVLKIGHVEAEDRSTHKALLIFKERDRVQDRWAHRSPDLPQC